MKSTILLPTLYIVSNLFHLSKVEKSNIIGIQMTIILSAVCQRQAAVKVVWL